MKKAFSIGLAVLIVLFVASTGLSTEDPIAEVTEFLEVTNTAIFVLIANAVGIASAAEQAYAAGEISNPVFRTVVTSAARSLIRESEKLVQEARLFAVSHGVRVKCYRVMVQLAFMQVSVDPLVVCDD